ncbi:MAG: LamG domain-containing protein [Candidatus Moraniibacteriota bacterium]
MLLLGSLVSAAPAEAAYYKQGIVLSTNMLSGATNVTAIASVTITATLPANTTARIKYSQNNVNFYNAAGTAEGYDTVAAGTNTIDISARGWSDSIFYYKIELATTDSAATPIISDVQVNYTGSATPAPGGTRYQYQGTLLSTNVLSGTSNVTAINSVAVTATLPGGATARIKYSQNNVNFYNAAGTAEGWDTVAAGTNTINIGALGWTGEIFYYKLEWNTIDNWQTPVISDVTVDYTGDVAGPPNCSGGCHTAGAFVSTDLMTGIGYPMRGTERFAYDIATLPGGSTVTAQFSQDGATWYSADGTLWGATTLSSGDHTEYMTAISLAALGWQGSTHFYYKLNLSTTDKTQVPVIASAGLLLVQMNHLNASQNSMMTNGLVGLWSFDGGDISGTTAYDRSGSGNNGTLTNSPAIGEGKVGQTLDFDGTDDYVSIADNAALDFGDTADFSLSGWFNRDTFTTDDTIIAKRNGVANTDDGYILYIDDTTDKLTFEVSEASGTDEYQMESTQAFTSSGWHHYTIVWDENSASGSDIYIDGVASNATKTGTIGNLGDLSNSVALAIGAESDAGNPFAGSLDETRMYNRALSASEIESLYALGQSDKINSSVSQKQGTGRLDSGLAGYWKLDENTGTSAGDASTNGNTGTLTNGPTWTTGQIGSAVTFDGSNDHVSVADSKSLDITNTLTIASWIKPTSVSPTGDKSIVRKEGADYSDNYSLILGGGGDAASGNIGFIYNSVGWRVFDSGYKLPDTQWHHVAVTFNYSNTQLLFYVDGLLVSTKTIVANLTTNTNALNIGMDVNNKYFSGSIDEVRIYNRALSVDEVSQLYRLAAPTGVDTSLKGYWSFNGQDMSGTTAYDRSGSGNNGTLTNGPAITEGKLGQGLNFDGSNDYVSTADYSFTSAQPFTMSAWFKTDSVSGNQVVFAKPNPNWEYSMKITGSTLTFIYWVTDASAAISLSAPSALVVGQWYFVTVTHDGSSAYMYVDGVSVASDTSTSGTYQNRTDNLQIGSGYFNGNSAFFDGVIDEVRIYNRALSAGEIQSLYNASR